MMSARLPVCPIVAAILAVGAYGLFVLWRLNALGGDPSTFVLAGPPNTAAGRTPPNLHVFTSGAAYDGQYYYRLALDPFGNQRSAYGIEFDEPAYRQERIVYPLVTWAISAGMWQLTPVALILVNLMAVGLLAYAAGAFAAGAGRGILASLSAPFYPGYIVTISRDLTELVEAALLVLGLLLVERGRYRLASTALIAGTLAKETLLVVPIAGALVWGFRRALGLSDRGPPLRLWLAPLVAYAVWYAVLLIRWGATDGLFAGRSNFGVPFQALIQHLGSINLATTRIWNTELPSLGLIGFALVGVVVSYGRSLFTASTAPMACVLAAFIAIAYSAYVWQDDYAYLRALHELFLTASLALLSRGVWLSRVLTLATVPMWVLFALQHGAAP